jgi:hypothetical protein
MDLTEEQKKELIKCSAGIITRDEIKEIINPVSYSEYLNLLNNSIEKNDTSYFEALFWDLPNNLKLKEEELLVQLFIVNSFHREHENMVSSFQTLFNNNKNNISVLLESINSIPEYLRPNDFKYPYIRKVIYAIGAQPEPYNIEALENLSNDTNDDEIRDLALHQIKKRKELGRWEFKKNKESQS